MDTKNKESFVMYDSFIQAGEFLSAEDFKKYILKIRDYALYGDETPSDNQVVNALTIMAKPNLKAAEERRQKAIENGIKGKEFGSLGGAPKKGETREEYDKRRLSRTLQEPLNIPQLTPNEPLNVNVDDDVKEKVDEKENENEEVEIDVKEDDDVLVMENNSSLSSSSLSSSSFSSGSQSSNNLYTEKTNTVNPSLIIEKKEELKTSNRVESAGTASDDSGMSAGEYLNQIFHENMQILKYYRMNNIKFDEKYKRAHNESTHAYMNYFGKTYEEADKFVDETLKRWIEKAKNNNDKSMNKND